MNMISAKKPMFSVCIPTYNRAYILPKVVQSVLSQTYKDLELFISDDASTDNTEDVVKGFGDARIRYHRNQKNLGVLDNWNFIIKNAAGEYVFKLDDDDYIAPAFLERVAAIFEKHPNVGSVYTGFYYAKDYNGNFIEKVVDRGIFKSEYIRGIDYVIEYLHHTSAPGLHPSSVVFRHSVAKEIGFFDKAKNDTMFSLALASKADVGYVYEPLFYYVQHTDARATYAHKKDYDFEPTRFIKDFFALDFIKDNAELMKIKDRVIKRERILRSIMHLIMSKKHFRLFDYLGISANMIKKDKKLFLSPLFLITMVGLIIVPKKVVERGTYMYKSKRIFTKMTGMLFKKGSK